MNSIALRALKEIGYSFPENKAKIALTLEELPIGVVTRLRDAYKHEFEFGLNRMNALIDSVVFSTCDICGEEKSSYGDIPKDWGWYSAEMGHHLMCDRCQVRYAEKFDELCEVVREI